MQIDINLDKNSYKVYIDELSTLKFKGKVAVITNSKVGGLYLAEVLSLIEADEKYAELAKKMGFKADTVEEGVNSLIEEINKLNNELNIPKSFKDAGIDETEFLAKVDLLADRAFEDQCTTANPRVPLVSEIKQMLLDSYYGV